MKWVDKILNTLFSKKNHFRISSENPDPLCPVIVLKIENKEQADQWEQGYKAGINWAVDNCTPDGNYPLPDIFNRQDIYASYGRGFMEGARCAGSQISNQYWNEKNRIQDSFFKKWPNRSYLIIGQIVESVAYHRLNELYIDGKLSAIMYDDENYQWHIECFT